jgi:hypothetical protein
MPFSLEEDKHMKIRLLQPGWETFTGNFGGVEFADGVSVNDANTREAARLANVVRCELEDGSNPSASQVALDSKGTIMQVGSDRAPAPAPVKYSRTALEEIAGAKGIKGLREIGDPMGVKASGIADLIEAILKAQQPGEPVVAPAADVPAAETAAPAAE